MARNGWGVAVDPSLAPPCKGGGVWRWRILVAALLAAAHLTAVARAETTAAEAPQLLAPELIAAGWLQLFDGQTLFGWQPTGDANWRVEEGAIVVDAGAPGWLMSTVDWADFELHLEFKAPAATNSGVFLRTAVEPTNPTRDCVEVNIAPRDNPFPTPSLVGREKLAVPGDAAVSGDQWRVLDIKAIGDKIEIRLDGKLAKQVLPTVVDRDAQSTPLRGRIGLQFNAGPVAFRHIRLRPLGLEPIFNGKDLAGWNTDLAEQSKFQVTDAGELQILNGRGQLESDASYGDFVLQLECFVNGDALNSGVFFRCIPREFTNGYESQIKNAMVDGDPTRPVDCGTGGIYRRINARRIVAADREWFANTIVATGPHIAVWVNGYPVTAWTDDRPPHDNPRSGLRTAPGTLALQGHDPTTDIRFRQLQIKELPPASKIQ
ncbi:MAG: DUF1080 domain-containing protein [Planctomycetales bacterium]|nr:DUF1080 domain-containing protein [Planctomycetales bacterium]